MKAALLAGALGALLQAVPCAAQDRAATLDLAASTDADGTEVAKAGLNLDWVHVGDDRFQGVRLEKAWFKPLGGKTKGFERVYARYADKGAGWSWSAQVGSDGHTALGAASAVQGSRWRKELFVERDILETPRGVSEGIYYTFTGAALDVPLSLRDTAVVVLGAQEFTGDNVRLHARATYVHVVKPDWGLSAQVRARYFHSTVPGEYDYFSPRWYAEVLPVAQLRRFDGGWRYVVAAGLGAQRASSSKWRSSRYLNAQLTTPPNRPVQLKASLVYSNTPVGSGFVYDYLQGSLAVTKRF